MCDIIPENLTLFYCGSNIDAMFNIAIDVVNFEIYVVNFKNAIERRQKSKMREVQRHNFEFLRTEVLKLSIEEFADKIGVSKSSYQRMKSESYDAEYYFLPIQKACELADISIDMFSTKYLTKELYKKRHKKTQEIVLSKKQLLAFLLFGVIALCVTFGITAKKNIYNNQHSSANTSLETEASALYEPNNRYFWTDKEGGSYHSKKNCPIIKNRVNIETGSLKDAQKKKKFDPCDFCVVQ